MTGSQAIIIAVCLCFFCGCWEPKGYVDRPDSSDVDASGDQDNSDVTDGSDATDDSGASDPGPVCNNGVLDQGETCDPLSSIPCPTSCDDNNRCTDDNMTGSPDECNVVCSSKEIIVCENGDACCQEWCITPHTENNECWVPDDSPGPQGVEVGSLFAHLSFKEKIGSAG